MERLYRGRLHVKVACLWSSLECPGSQAPLTRTRPPQAFAHTGTHTHTHTHTHLSVGPPLSLGWDEPTKAPPGAVPPAALDLHLSYQPLHTDVAKSQGTPLSGSGVEGGGRYVCLCMCVQVCTCLYTCMCERVFACVYICAEGGSIPRHKLLSFLESLWPTQEERVGGGGGGGGEGTEALGEQSLISNLPKTGVFMLWCWGPLLCREMLSQRCNIHLGIGPGGGRLHRPPVLH